MLSSSVNCTSFTEARMVVVRSLTRVSLTEPGSVFSSFDSAFFTRSAVATMLAPGSRWILRTTAGCPLKRTSVSLFSMAVTTRATSRTRTGALFRQVTTRSE
jgi:hypothetical protein